MPGVAVAADAAQVIELEERGPGDELAAAQPGEQGDAAGDRDQARAGGDGQVERKRDACKGE